MTKELISIDSPLFYSSDLARFNQHPLSEQACLEDKTKPGELKIFSWTDLGVILAWENPART